MSEKNISKIGKKIAQIRRDKKLSQEKLANLSGLDRSHIGFIEQGRRVPTISTLTKISRALNTSVEEILKGL